jgi:hypothetical protein
MNQNKIFNLLENAMKSDDLKSIQEIYETGKKELHEMPMVHNHYALFLQRKNNNKKAYSVIKESVAENKNHLVPETIESLFEYGRSHFYAFSISKNESWLPFNKKVYHVANEYWSIYKAEEMNMSSEISQISKDRQWAVGNPFLGRFLPSYYKCLILNEKEFLYLPDVLNCKFNDLDRKYAAIGAYTFCSYLLRRLIMEINSPTYKSRFDNTQDGPAFFKWLNSAYKQHFDICNTEMSRIESQINEFDLSFVIESNELLRNIEESLQKYQQKNSDFAILCEEIV